MDTFNKTSHFKITKSKKKLKGNAGTIPIGSLNNLALILKWGKQA